MMERDPLKPGYWQGDGPGVDKRQITYRSSAYVAPSRQTDIVRRVPQPLELPASPAQVVSNNTATDRAQEFVIETRRLSLGVGLLAVLVAWVGLDWPLWTSAMLLLFGVFYVAVWVFVWLIHRALTPEAIALLRECMTWVWLFRRG